MRNSNVGICGATAVVALALLAAPQALGADAQSVIEQYGRASESYGVSPGARPEFVLAYPAHVMDDLARRWFPISALDAGAGAVNPANIKRACEGDRPYEITVPNRFSIVVFRAGRTGSFSTTYSVLGGLAFSAYTEPASYMAFFGLDPADDRQAETGLQAVRQLNGPTTLHRPSPDILAVENGADFTTIFARCAD